MLVEKLAQKKRQNPPARDSENRRSTVLEFIFSAFSCFHAHKAVIPHEISIFLS